MGLTQSSVEIKLYIVYIYISDRKTLLNIDNYPDEGATDWWARFACIFTLTKTFMRPDKESIYLLSLYLCHVLVENWHISNLDYLIWQNSLFKISKAYDIELQRF